MAFVSYHRPVNLHAHHSSWSHEYDIEFLAHCSSLSMHRFKYTHSLVQSSDAMHWELGSAATNFQSAIVGPSLSDFYLRPRDAMYPCGARSWHPSPIFYDRRWIEPVGQGSPSNKRFRLSEEAKHRCQVEYNHMGSCLRRSSLSAEERFEVILIDAIYTAWQSVTVWYLLL